MKQEVANHTIITECFQTFILKYYIISTQRADETILYGACVEKYTEDQGILTLIDQSIAPSVTYSYQLITSIINRMASGTVPPVTFIEILEDLLDEEDCTSFC